jgi:hypothetical protein
VDRIYSKIGASTRSTATLFAVQCGLLDSLKPLNLGSSTPSVGHERPGSGGQ